ncbi:exonuclease subunit SbcD [Tessaracoccus coleopterorum]|uniref:exonuclease subunit SbcD n=1 Tax=Tessaracoccus coleopterorum TaxID=2714950 RepID=UPI0018D48196|nr:exonuclease subunit SbcD [Tessaracoccus coleopterorum]
MLDELNKHAPREGNSPIKEVLLDIAERGRSLGIILIGAQQTASEVERRIVSNSSIRIVGRLDPAEAGRPEYGFLPASQRQRATLAKPGAMFVSQPELPVPLAVEFPFPAWATRESEVAPGAPAPPTSCPGWPATPTRPRSDEEHREVPAHRRLARRQDAPRPQPAGEQQAVLAEIIDIALREEVDAVLVAGDLYDTAAPSAEAQRLVNGALLRLASSGIEVVVIAGNHDHARSFEALRQLMAVAGIQYAGAIRAAAEGGVHRFTARSTGEEAVVALVPFVSRRYIVGSEEIVTGTPSDNAGRYEASVREIISALATSFTPETVNIVMGHLTCTGGLMGGGEREAQSIFEYHVSAQSFPITAHYVALGHLHRRQQIPAPTPVHYSGAPIAVDFGEQENSPVVCLVEATPSTPARVTDIPITAGRRLRTVSGTVEQLKASAEGSATTTCGWSSRNASGRACATRCSTRCPTRWRCGSIPTSRRPPPTTWRNSRAAPRGSCSPRTARRPASTIRA